MYAERAREKVSVYSVQEGEVGYSGTAEPCDMTQMHWCWRERESERRGMGGEEEEEGCEITLLFYLFLTRAHECSHTHLHTHTAGDATIAASKWLHINIQWKATSTVACDTVAINKWEELYTLLASRTCRTEGGNMSMAAHAHTLWFREYAASKPQLPKPALHFSFSILFMMPPHI